MIFFVVAYEIRASLDALHATRVCDYRAVLGLQEELGLGHSFYLGGVFF